MFCLALHPCSISIIERLVLVETIPSCILELLHYSVLLIIPRNPTLQSTTAEIFLDGSCGSDTPFLTIEGDIEESSTIILNTLKL